MALLRGLVGRAAIGNDKETDSKEMKSLLYYSHGHKVPAMVVNARIIGFYSGEDPKGMGGAWRDDHQDNIQATHWWCNEEKGSTRMD